MPFDLRLKNHRIMILAMLKLGFPYAAVLDMTEPEIAGHLEAYEALLPEKTGDGTTYYNPDCAD